MTEKLTNEKKKFISITPKDSELIIINTGSEVKEVLSWALPFYSPNAVNDGVMFAIDKANELDDLNARGCALDIIKESFPDIFQELKENLFKGNQQVSRR